MTTRTCRGCPIVVAKRSAWAILLSFSLIYSPVAACCDDFWSCAAAIATSGLTCAAEVALGLLRSTIEKAQVVRTDVNDETLAELKLQVVQLQTELKLVDEQLNEASREIDQVGKEADRLVGRMFFDGSATAAGATGVSSGAPEKTGVATSAKITAAKSTSGGALKPMAPPSPDATILDDSLARLKKLIDEIRQQKAALVAAVVEKEKEASLRGTQETVRVEGVARNSVLQPLDDMIVALQKAAASPANIPDLVTQTLILLDTVWKGFDTAVVDALSASHDNLIVAAQGPAVALVHLQDAAQEAGNLLAALRQAVSLKNELERTTLVNNLRYKVATAPAPVKAALGKPSLSPAFVAASAASATRYASLKSELRQLSLPLRTVDVSAFRAQMVSQFDRYFKGGSAAAAKQNRDELLAEARARFAKDPQTLHAVEKLLVSEASSRGVL